MPSGRHWQTPPSNPQTRWPRGSPILGVFSGQGNRNAMKGTVPHGCCVCTVPVPAGSSRCRCDHAGCPRPGRGRVRAVGSCTLAVPPPGPAPGFAHGSCAAHLGHGIPGASEALAMCGPTCTERPSVARLETKPAATPLRGCVRIGEPPLSLTGSGRAWLRGALKSFSDPQSRIAELHHENTSTSAVPPPPGHCSGSPSSGLLGSTGVGP